MGIGDHSIRLFAWRWCVFFYCTEVPTPKVCECKCHGILISRECYFTE